MKNTSSYFVVLEQVTSTHTSNVNVVIDDIETPLTKSAIKEILAECIEQYGSNIAILNIIELKGE